MEQGSSSEGNISTVTEEKHRTIRNLTVHYHGHRSSLLVPILSQFNLVPAVPYHPIFYIRVNKNIQKPVTFIKFICNIFCVGNIKINTKWHRIETCYWISRTYNFQKWTGVSITRKSGTKQYLSWSHIACNFVAWVCVTLCVSECAWEKVWDYMCVCVCVRARARHAKRPRSVTTNWHGSSSRFLFCI